MTGFGRRSRNGTTLSLWRVIQNGQLAADK